MAKEMKSLAKETAIYGVSSIVGKFLNWLLVPLYTYILATTADYGIVTNLYAWTAFLFVILTYGMETGFFRFVNKAKDQHEARKVYGNSLIAVGTTSALFIIAISLFHQPIANLLQYSTHSEFVLLLGITVSMDAFASIPFAFLRYQKRPIKFASFKLLYIVLNIAFNLFFLIGCPYLLKVAPSSINWFYQSNYEVGYVFVSNFLATFIQTLILLPNTFVARFELDKKLLKQLLTYSFPLVFLGIAGIANQNLDKILFPFLQLGEQGKAELGVYGAVYKIAMIIMMFTQAFRYAYEPYVFAKYKDKDSKKTYAEAMKYYVIFSLLIFLGMVAYLDLIKFLIEDSYWGGLNVVPIILFSYVFQGVFFNLSIWYKLTNQNKYGAYISAIGTFIIFIGNILLVPYFNYWGSAWAAFAGYFTVMLISYFLGQKKMPIDYNLKTLGHYLGVAIVLFILISYIKTPWIILNITIKTLLLLVYIGAMLKRDIPIREFPYIKRLFR